MEGQMSKANPWVDYFSDNRTKRGQWRKTRRRVGRAGIPASYKPASDTKKFYLYRFGQVIEIVSGGFQFARIHSDRYAAEEFNLPTGYSPAKGIVEEFAGGEEGTYLDGTPGIRGKIRTLPNGREMVIWHHKNLERLELVLFEVGYSYSSAMEKWVDRDNRHQGSCEFKEGGAIEISPFDKHN